MELFLQNLPKDLQARIDAEYEEGPIYTENIRCMYNWSFLEAVYVCDLLVDQGFLHKGYQLSNSDSNRVLYSAPHDAALPSGTIIDDVGRARF